MLIVEMKRKMDRFSSNILVKKCLLKKIGMQYAKTATKIYKKKN